MSWFDLKEIAALPSEINDDLVGRVVGWGWLGLVGVGWLGWLRFFFGGNCDYFAACFFF